MRFEIIAEGESFWVVRIIDGGGRDRKALPKCL